MNRIGQIFGTRKILKNECVDKDWIDAEMPIPKTKEAKSNYVLAQCLNCGSIKPTILKNLIQHPPKRCSFCSNIHHTSNIESYTNTWALYPDESIAVVNIPFGKEICSVYIDLEDYEKCSEKKWRISKKRNKYYVISGSKKKGTMIYLHQFLMGEPPKGHEIDHKDGNSLNNRKNNLRFLTRGDNARFVKARIDNKIGIRGVSFDKRSGKYVVDFSFQGARCYFKQWNTLEEAVWCRYCAEEICGLETLKSNPLLKEYDTLNDQLKEDIYSYVLSIIKRNIWKQTV